MIAVHVNEVLKIAEAIDEQYQIRDGGEFQRALKVLMVHLGVIDIKADAARKTLGEIQKLAKHKGIPDIERSAKEALRVLQ